MKIRTIKFVRAAQTAAAESRRFLERRSRTNISLEPVWRLRRTLATGKYDVALRLPAVIAALVHEARRRGWRLGIGA